MAQWVCGRTSWETSAPGPGRQAEEGGDQTLRARSQLLPPGSDPFPGSRQLRPAHGAGHTLSPCPSLPGLWFRQTMTTDEAGASRRGQTATGQAEGLLWPTTKVSALSQGRQGSCVVRGSAVPQAQAAKYFF